MIAVSTALRAPQVAIVVNEPSQAALARAYAYLDEMQPVIEARRRERAGRGKGEDVVMMSVTGGDPHGMTHRAEPTP